MHGLSYRGAADRAARALVQSYGVGSAAEAAHRANERFANIDLGGFAYWKSVERVIQTVIGDHA